MQDGGVIPDSGFPRVSGMEMSDNSDTVQTVQLIQHMHSFTAVASGLYLRSVHFRGGSSFIEGSRHSRDVVEVVVHAATVVVHVFVDVQVDGSGTRDVGVLVGPVLAV